MKTLILETSTEKSCLVLAKGDRAAAYLPLPGGPELSKRLALEVSLLLEKYSFHPERIAVGTGPGSFTGIRVGAALAKALAFGWRIPLLGFCSLKAFAPSQEGAFAILVDARMGGIYVLKGVKKKEAASFETAILCPLAELEKALGGASLLSSPHPALIQKRIALSLPWIETAPDAPLLARVADRQFHEGGASPLKLDYLALIESPQMGYDRGVS